MKKYRLINRNYDIDKDLNIKNILLWNYTTKKILLYYDMNPYYVGSKLFVDAEEDIISNFLLHSDGSIGFEPSA